MSVTNANTNGTMLPLMTPPVLEGSYKIKAINDALIELNNWKASQGTSNPLSYEYGLQAVLKLYNYAGVSSLAPLLGHLLCLKGRPMTLDRHFPHEPLFERFNIPQRFLMKCGRQVGKSQSLSAQGIVQSTLMPNFNTIFICPLYEQIRRFSSNYIRPLINDSPIKSLIIQDSLQAQNVLQRTLANGSIMFFTFCFLDVERVRGISADKLVIDEVQDIDWDFLPIIEHCLSASPHDIKQFSGTPKSFDNTIQMLWEESSQGEWVIPCDCGYWNTCTITADLDKMIQRPGLSCAKCGRLVDSRLGHYEHTYPEKRSLFASYHVPQAILPIHFDYRDQERTQNKWYKLFMQKEKSKTAYYNECLGESCDSGTKLVSLSDLQKAAVLPWSNTIKEALENAGQYHAITMGVDWGGGAGGIIKRTKGTIKIEGGSPSFTVVSIVGFKYGSTTPHLIYAERLNSSFTPQQEIQVIMDYYKRFRCYRFAHDFGGSGNIREAMLIQAGFQEGVIMPVQYVRASNKNICVYQPPINGGSRFYYSLDKARSLALLCQIIKAENGLKFPKCDWGRDRDERYELVLRDFLSLIEDKHEAVAGSDVYLITRNPKQPDDFCHSLNYACVAHWHYLKEYPNLAEQYGISLTDSQSLALDPNPSLEDWSAH